MATKRLNPLHKPVHPYAAWTLLVGFVVLTIVAFSLSSRFTSPSMTQKSAPTPTSPPAPIIHPKISIPPADWLNNSYQYYDSNLDATVNVPNGWSIVNDPSAAGLSMPGVKPQPVNACYPSDKAFFKDFSQCQTTLGYALKITPNAATPNSNFLVLMGVSNGFGGSCNETLSNGRLTQYDTQITINNHSYTVPTVISTKAFGGFTSAGVHLDCYYWPRISEAGSKSPWAMFNVRHRATDNATFVTEMQILENIQFH